MIKYEFIPLIYIRELEKILEENQFNSENLRHILFGDSFMNDVCARLYIEEDDNEAPEVILIKNYLRQAFPNNNYVLVDLIW